MREEYDLSQSYHKRFRDVAIVLHGPQPYGEHPYKKHLQDVYEELCNAGVKDIAVLDASWIHDVFEDTPITREAILKMGLPDRETTEESLDIALAVTDEPGFSNRKLRKAATYPKIKALPKAILVKLADRVANVKACVEDGFSDKFWMYHKEHSDFKNGILREQQDLGEEEKKLWAALEHQLFDRLDDLNYNKFVWERYRTEQLIDKKRESRSVIRSLPKNVPMEKLQEWYDAGHMLSRESLKAGVFYYGHCRNAQIARWDGERFRHIRDKFGIYLEYIKHPEDEQYSDVFQPYTELDAKYLRLPFIKAYIESFNILKNSSRN